MEAFPNLGQMLSSDCIDLSTQHRPQGKVTSFWIARSIDTATAVLGGDLQPDRVAAFLWLFRLHTDLNAMHIQRMSDLVVAS